MTFPKIHLNEVGKISPEVAISLGKAIAFKDSEAANLKGTPLGNVIFGVEQNATNVKRSVREYDSGNFGSLTALAAWPTDNANTALRKPGKLRFTIFSTADKGTGSQNGAREITVNGWDENWNRVEGHTVALDQDAFTFIDPSGKLFWYVDRMRVSAAGSTGANQGNMFVDLIDTDDINLITTGGIDVISLGVNVTNSAQFWVPPHAWCELCCANIFPGTLIATGEFRIEIATRKTNWTYDSIADTYSLNVSSPVGTWQPTRTAFCTADSGQLHLIEEENIVMLPPGTQIDFRSLRVGGTGGGKFSADFKVNLFPRELIDG